MKPEISEFSYGFALTNELVGWVALSAAPVFPSLIEEGKAGGGYDVKLDRPGVPLFLQFKRSHCMVRRTAKEHQAVVALGGTLNVPYYRFPITEATTSDQHELLLALDDGSSHQMVGFYTINEETLQALNADTLGKLHDKGYLQAIYMQIASHGNIRDLLKRKNAKQNCR